MITLSFHHLHHLTVFLLFIGSMFPFSQVDRETTLGQDEDAPQNNQTMASNQPIRAGQDSNARKVQPARLRLVCVLAGEFIFALFISSELCLAV